jgi:hypothetical protein
MGSFAVLKGKEMRKKLISKILLVGILLIFYGGSCDRFYIGIYEISLSSGEKIEEIIGVVDKIEYKIRGKFDKKYVGPTKNKKNSSNVYPWYFRVITQISIEIKNESQECVVFDVKKIRLISKYYHYKFYGSGSLSYSKGDNRGRFEQNKVLWRIFPGEKHIIWVHFITDEIVTLKKKRPHIEPDEELILYIDGISKGSKKVPISNVRLVPKVYKKVGCCYL